MNEMLSLDAALARLLAAARPVADAEIVSTFHAAGRVLAVDQSSAITVPPRTLPEPALSSWKASIAIAPTAISRSTAFASAASTVNRERP